MKDLFDKKFTRSELREAVNGLVNDKLFTGNYGKITYKMYPYAVEEEGEEPYSISCLVVSRKDDVSVTVHTADYSYNQLGQLIAALQNAPQLKNILYGYDIKANFIPHFTSILRTQQRELEGYRKYLFEDGSPNQYYSPTSRKIRIPNSMKQYLSDEILLGVDRMP